MSEREVAANPYFPDRTEPADLEYHQVDRAGRQPAWAWGLLSVASAVGGFLVAQVAVSVPFIVVMMLLGDDPDTVLDRLTGIDDPEPVTLAYLLAAISASIPVIMVLHRLITGLKPRWLVSVAGRLRWTWLLASMGLALATLFVSIVVAGLLPASDSGAAPADGVNDVTSTTLQFLLVIVLLVPFQAAAEEYVFRGLMMQGFGSLTANLWIARVVAVVVPAIIFALFHGATQSLPVFFDRFAFGIVAGILTILTGGMEAGIGYHVVNNWLAFGLGLFFGDMGDTLNPQGGGWIDVAVSVGKSVLFVVLAVVVARRMGLQTTVPRTVLEPGHPRV